LVGDTEASLRLGEEHHPAIRRDPSAIEGGAHLLARYRWQVKGQRDIVHKSLPLLDRCAAASATGIMPHIHVSGYFRLTVPADEVIEYRGAEGRYDRLPTLAADLVGRRVVVEIHGSVVAWASRFRRRARNAMSARRAIGIIVVLVLSTFYPLSSAAQQQAKVFHIGFLSSGLRSGGVFSRDEFRQAFHDSGYVEGKNIVIEERFAESEVSRLPALVAELVELKVDVMVTTGWAAAQAAKKATSTIPIVLACSGAV
jgi:hypothetical protein